MNFKQLGQFTSIMFINVKLYILRQGNNFHKNFNFVFISTIPNLGVCALICGKSTEVSKHL